MPTLDINTIMQVLNLTRDLSAHDELQPLLNGIVEVGKRVLEAEQGSVFLYDAQTEELYTTLGAAEIQIRIPLNSGIAGDCAGSRRIINVPDCYCDDRFNREVDNQTGFHTRSLLSIPLIGLDEILIGVMQFLNAQQGGFSEADEHIAAFFANQAAVALQKALLLEDRAERLRMQYDLEIARSIQQQMLPATIPVIPGYDIALYNQPSDETGGDMYDLHWCEETRNEVLLVLADATGHGIGSALAVTQLRSLLRMGIHTVDSLAKLVGMVNTQLMEDLPAAKFITAFICKLQLDNHRLKYLAPGQAPLLHYCATSGEWYDMGATSPPLGVLALDEEMQPVEVALAEGDLLVLLTDGFYEYENDAREQFGKERVTAAVLEQLDQPAASILQTLVEQVKAFGGNRRQADDMTAIILKRTA